VASVVFLRAVNVGKANRCQPALIAKQLAKFGVVNIGAVGTFVVRENVSESTLRPAIAKKLPFKCEIMICPARDVIKRGFGPIIAPLKTHFLGLIRLSFILSRSRSGGSSELTTLCTGQPARAFRSDCLLHRKSESQHHVSGCKTSRSRLRR
jgi:hypothetical protein